MGKVLMEITMSLDGYTTSPEVSIGLASAVSGQLSPLYFLKEQAGWFIPIGRFSGLLVSGIAGVRLGSPGCVEGVF